MDLNEFVSSDMPDSITKKSEADWLLNINKTLTGSSQVDYELVMRMDNIVLEESSVRLELLSKVIMDIPTKNKVVSGSDNSDDIYT